METCIICIETHKDGKPCKPLTSLVSSETCVCDYYVHSSCLDEWITKKNSKCLICGEPLEYKSSILFYYLFAWIFVCVISNIGLVLIVYMLSVVITSEFM